MLAIGFDSGEAGVMGDLMVCLRILLSKMAGKSRHVGGKMKVIKGGCGGKKEGLCLKGTGCALFYSITLTCGLLG